MFPKLYALSKPSVFTINDESDPNLQPQSTRSISHIRLKLFRRRHIPPNPDVRGHTAARILCGRGAKPRHTSIRSSADCICPNLFHVHLSTPNPFSRLDLVFRQKYSITFLRIFKV